MPLWASCSTCVYPLRACESLQLLESISKEKENGDYLEAYRGPDRRYPGQVSFAWEGSISSRSIGLVVNGPAWYCRCVPGNMDRRYAMGRKQLCSRMDHVDRRRDHFTADRSVVIRTGRHSDRLVSVDLGLKGGF